MQYPKVLEQLRREFTQLPREETMIFVFPADAFTLGIGVTAACVTEQYLFRIVTSELNGIPFKMSWVLREYRIDTCCTYA